MNMVHVSANRIRYELYDDPTYSSAENLTVLRLAGYMAEESLSQGVSVIFDMHLPTATLRRSLRDMVDQLKGVMLTVWVQTDFETARYRALNRDRRRTDDRYTPAMSQQQFTRLAKPSKPAEREAYTVISGKHLFKFQHQTVTQRLIKMAALPTVEPPNTRAGRVDLERRQPHRSLNG
jgi:predicted kinase